MVTNLDKKPTVIIIYGPIAVGKLTVGKELAKQTGFKLTHNHLINDLVRSIFDRGTKESNYYIEKLRYEMYVAAIRASQSIIITHAYAANYISPSGLSDPDYLRTLEKKLTKLGANVLFVHLQTHNEVLLKRVSLPSRKEYKKLLDKKILKDLHKTTDWKTTAPVKNNLIIDNTNLSPKKVVSTILKHFNVK